MNWEAIGAIGEVVGAIAVILSLLYVGRQIHTSSQIALAVTERDAAKAWSDTTASLSQDPQIASVYARGIKNEDELSEHERIQFESLINRMMLHHSNVLRMYEKGLVEKDLLDSTDRVVLGLLRSEGVVQWWNGFGQYFTESYQQHVSDLLSSTLESEPS